MEPAADDQAGETEREEQHVAGRVDAGRAGGGARRAGKREGQEGDDRLAHAPSDARGLPDRYGARTARIAMVKDRSTDMVTVRLIDS